MQYLVDTSVLVRAVHIQDPSSLTARTALAALLRADHRLCVLPRNLAEFWFACTRPVQSNGLAYSYARTQRYVEKFEPHFELFHETSAVYTQWRRLLTEHKIVGRQLFDARLAAAAMAHGFDRVLTFDIAHFSRYRGIAVVHPADV